MPKEDQDVWGTPLQDIMIALVCYCKQWDFTDLRMYLAASNVLQEFLEQPKQRRPQ